MLNVADHQGLVNTIVTKYVAKSLQSKHDFDDLMQEINLHICDKASKYDPSKGAASTYITCIAQRYLYSKHRYNAKRPAVIACDVIEQVETKQISELSADAKVAMDEARQLLDEESRKLSRVLREKLTHRLKKLYWDSGRIKDAFSEIREVLSTDAPTPTYTINTESGE